MPTTDATCFDLPARRAGGRGPGRAGPRPRHPGHLLAQGVHPAHDAVPRPVRLLHLRPAAGPARRALPHPRSEVLASPVPAPRRVPRGAVHPGRAARGPLPGGAPSGWPSTATPRPSTTSPPCAAWCSTRPACSPTPTPARSPPTSSPRCAPCRPSQGMMIESLNPRPRLPPGRARQDARAPPGHARGRRRAGHPVHHRHPRRHRRVPTPTGSTPWRRSPASHRRHGHVQEVIVQNFLPKPGTAMHAGAAVPAADDYLEAIALARLILPPEVHLQAPPNLSDDFGVLLDAGIDDWGGVSPVTADHVNPERPWPALDRLREVTEARGLRPRPPAHDLPRVRARPRPLARRRPALRGHGPLRRRGPRPRRPGRGVPAEGRPHRRRSATAPRCILIGHRSTQWYSGADVDAAGAGARPRRPGPGRGARGARRRACSARRSGDDEIVTLFSARGPEVAAVAEVADELRREAVGDVVTYVRNRNINYTNVCTFKCRFCGFSKGPLSLNLRGTPYLLTLDDIAGRVPGGLATSAPPRCACRAASTPTSTATTTSTSPGP